MSTETNDSLKNATTAFIEAIAIRAFALVVEKLLPQINQLNIYFDERLPMPIVPGAVYNRDQAARVTGLSETTLIAQEKAGNLVADRVESSVRYFGQSLIDMLQRQRLDASAKASQ